MPGIKNLAKYWLPVLIWMAVIFSASTGAMSDHRTSRIIRPVLLWLFPGIQETTIGTIHLVVRKSAHATEYALLSLLFWRALRKPIRRDSRPWGWDQARLAWLLSALYALSDEWHQSFVPSRQALLGDVAIDVTGAAAGLLLLWLLGRGRRHW